MPTIRTVPGPPRIVMGNLLDAAASLGLEASISDPAAGHFEFRTAPRSTGRAPRITVALTDNGFGDSVVHVEIDPGGWRGRRASSRLVKRLDRLCRDG